MSKFFNKVQVFKPKSNLFDLSHERKMSFNMGELIPFLHHEIIPGDHFRVNSEIYCKLAPMLAPIMHRVNVFTHYFFVPNRLLYSDWETFITGGETGNEIPPFPTITVTNDNKAQFYEGTLWDYFGLPITNGADTVWANPKCSALPFRAYAQIFNDYYIDQNLSAPIAMTKDNVVTAQEVTAITTLRKRAWEKDYFTSALPWTQRGGEVSIPSTINYVNPARAYSALDGSATGPATGDITSGVSGNVMSGSLDVSIHNIDNMDISINDLRRSARLQEWLEKNARAGSRYIEQILSHFGVVSSDARLQRAEYLGGGKQPIIISEVLNTTGTTENPQGNMSGHGMSAGKSNYFSKSFEEFGQLIGIISILPRTAYSQGFDRSFIKFDKFDYYWPEFANLGEQPIYKGELFYNYQDTNEKVVFGYTPRYAEYKFKQSSIAGEMRSTLNHWHMGRELSPSVSLNEQFVTADPTHRIFAVEDETSDKVYMQIYNSVKARRPMPIFGTPTL